LIARSVVCAAALALAAGQAAGTERILGVWGVDDWTKTADGAGGFLLEYGGEAAWTPDEKSLIVHYRFTSEKTNACGWHADDAPLTAYGGGDITGNLHVGTVNAPVYVPEHGGGFFFDGADDYIQLADPATNLFKQNSVGYWAAWIRLGNNGASYKAAWNFGGDRHHTLYAGYSGKLRAEHREATTNIYGLSSSAMLADTNTCYLVAWACNGETNISDATWWVNGCPYNATHSYNSNSYPYRGQWWDRIPAAAGNYNATIGCNVRNNGAIKEQDFVGTIYEAWAGTNVPDTEYMTNLFEYGKTNYGYGP